MEAVCSRGQVCADVLSVVRSFAGDWRMNVISMNLELPELATLRGHLLSYLFIDLVFAGDVWRARQLVQTAGWSLCKRGGVAVNAV